MLMEFLRNLAMGAIADEVRKTPQGKDIQEEYVAPVANRLMDAIIPPAAASGADAIDTSRQDQLDALIAAENRMQPQPTANPLPQMQMPAPANPSGEIVSLEDMTRRPVVQQAYPSSLSDVQMPPTAEERAMQTQDFVRQNTVPEKLSEQQAAAKVTETAKRLQAEAPDAKEDEVIAAAVVEEGKNDPSFFDALGGKIGDFFGSEKNMLSLALAFNSLRYQPDQGLASVLGKRLETLDTQSKNNKTAIVVAQRLQQMGYPQYAKIVMERPDMAPEILKQIMQKEFKPDAAIKTSGVQIDPVTGQKYLVKTDPNTGDVERIDIPNAIGLTPQAEADLEAATASNTLDQKTAIEYGQKIFDQAQSINGQIGRLEEVTRSIDAGAVTGPVSQFLPTISKATAQLEAAANSLGIDIINSATFGALSEAELRLALSTGLPQGLPEDELRLWVKDKIAAQKKMRDELFRQAQTLMSGGVRYTEWASNFAKKSLEKSAQESAPAQAPIARPAAPAVQSSDDGFTVKEIR
jgi:hypothetical protein